MLEDKLVLLKKELIAYAGHIETMMDTSIAGLKTGDKDLLLSVINELETRANHYEIEIDELCTNILAQYQPRAKNLRLILMIQKMNNDLERMGDHAVNIAESALFLIEQPPVKPLIDTPRMAEITIRMLKDGIDSFINENPGLAKTVCERDNEVDDLKDSITSELARIMAQDSSTIERSLQLLRIAENLERVADLSTNICEDVLYMVQGRVIKHHLEEEQQQGGEND